MVFWFGANHEQLCCGDGQGGFFESEGEHGEAQGKTAGILHIGVLDLDYTLAPVFNMCVNEISTPDREV
jgi:hypothetical protein